MSGRVVRWHHRGCSCDKVHDILQLREKIDVFNISNIWGNLGRFGMCFSESYNKRFTFWDVPVSSLIVLPYTWPGLYLAPGIVSKLKPESKNIPKPSKNIQKRTKTGKNTQKKQNCLKKLRNGLNVRFLFEPSRPMPVPPARRRGCATAAAATFPKRPEPYIGNCC